MPRRDRLFLPRLVDTFAGIEWLVGLAAEPRPPQPADWRVPAILRLEPAEWLMRKAGDDKADRGSPFRNLVLTCSRTPRLLRAPPKPALLGPVQAEAMALATARAGGLLTRDARFDGLPGAARIRRADT